MSIYISPILGIVYMLLAASAGACVGLFFAACFRSGAMEFNYYQRFGIHFGLLEKSIYENMD